MTPTVLAAGDPTQTLAAAAIAIEGGLIVGLPTETVYGLAVLPQDGPLAALVAAKGRPLDKGIALLIDGLDQVDRAGAHAPTRRRRLAARVLARRADPRAAAAAGRVAAGGSSPVAGRTLGVRLPDHPVPRTLARRLGPLAVSSANRSGEPDARTAAELVASVGAAAARSCSTMGRCGAACPRPWSRSRPTAG